MDAPRLPAALRRRFLGTARLAGFAAVVAGVCAYGAVGKPPVGAGASLNLGVFALAAAALAVGVLWRRARAELNGARRRLEEAAMTDEVLEGASVLVWSADVARASDGQLRWQVTSRRISQAGRLLGIGDAFGAAKLWNPDRVPDHAVMDRVVTGAIEAGHSGYRHEFRFTADGGPAWLLEQAAIHRRGERKWRLLGVVTDITERHRLEDAGRKSAEQLQRILEQADCLLWQADVSHLDGVWNWSFDLPSSGLRRRIFGESGLADPRRIYAGFHVPSLAENNRRSQGSMLSGAPGYDQEFKLIRESNGEVFWIHERVSISSLGPGRWHLAGVMMDVTSRYRADQARRETEEQLNRILMGVDCMLWLADVTLESTGAFTWRLALPDSLLYRKLFGYDPASKGNILWSEQNVPDMVSLNERSSSALLTGAPGYEQEFCFFSQAGVHWLHEQVAVKPAGPNAWQAVGVVTDITARRTAERELAAEKERLAVTLRAMEEGVITLGLDGTVLYVNRAAEVLLTVVSDDLRGRLVSDLCCLVDSTTGRDLDWPVRPVLRDGEAVDLPVGAAIRLDRRRVVDVEGCVVPLRDPQSVVLGAVVVIRDVTDRRRLENQLQRASKLESVGLLAGGIAHDFNNILTAVMGNLGLARSEVPLESPAHLFIQEAHRAADRARGLTQQLLTFAKGGEPVRAAVELADVATEVAGFAVRGSRVRCEFDFPEGLWPANADRGQLAQIIQNLVINAVQAMPGGGVVKLSASNELVPPGSALPVVAGDYVRISIEDTGSGIPTEDLSRVFEPYFTTKETGSGLGLATVYSIVRRHKGCIDVESEPGRGARFVIRLPALRGGRVETGTVQSAPATMLGGRILIMDDEEPIRILLGHVLRRAGLEVVATSNGREALDTYREQWERGSPPDALMMDLTVPGDLGGAQALAEIRKFDPDVRAIVASGYSSDPVVANFRDYGFCGRVVKPFDVQQVIRVVTDVLAKADRDAGG